METLDLALDAPLVQPQPGGAAQAPPVVTEAVRHALRRKAVSAGYRVSVMLSLTTGLLIAAAAAAEWAAPSFETLPSLIALGSFAGAVAAAVTARLRFHDSVVRAALAMGLPLRLARAEARAAWEQHWKRDAQG